MENMIYVVVPGDTLWKLSQQFGTDVDTIARYNGIADPDQLDVGQVLRIPPQDSCRKMDIYIVRSGDTLFEIAGRHNTTVEMLVELNDIQDPDSIEPGMILRLPTMGCEKKPSATYTVKEGDTLFKIAKMFCTTVTNLINLNRLTCPDRIYPGQVLRISS